MKSDALHLVRALEDEDGPDAAPVSFIGPEGKPQMRAFLSQPAHHNHIVQFYEDEGFLSDTVAHFISSGLDRGEPIIIIATEAHRTAFAQRLKRQGYDIDRACASSQLTLLDAHATLERFMVDDTPDRERFRAVLGGTIEKILAGRPGHCIRAYGEMVDLLWRDGNPAAAIHLEELWNELGKSHSFSLLCAYAMNNFYHSGDEQPFQSVCRVHTHVIPTERHATVAGPHERLREVSLLQQRARSLEFEIERRKELESALREALARERLAREEADRNVRFNEMFAGILGHDLRNPLSAIGMGATYIARGASGDKATKAAARILASTERMSRMIDQLLDFTRIRVGGGLGLNRALFELADICVRARSELETANPDAVFAFEARGTTGGYWDYDRMLQMFSNLLGNAISHGAPGGVVTVTLDGSDPASVTATVHNRGAIAPEVLPMIFEPFRGTHKQLRTTGLGLGLYITHQIVLAHGGTIEAVSDGRSDTTMRVWVPRVPRMADSPKIQP